MLFNKEKGRVLKIKTGYNPNSSSIGTNLSPLLIAGAILSIVVPILTFIFVRKIRKKKD